jgi:acyl-coenzyme A synthetase/AMP-(fatty) acid ligase
MNMPQSKPASIRAALETPKGESTLFGLEGSLSWAELLIGTVLPIESPNLRGKNVLVATRDQLNAAAVFVELDGLAQRIVLYPPDLSLDHLDFVSNCCAADVIVSDRLSGPVAGIPCLVPGAWKDLGGDRDPGEPSETEWILLTSGTTGRPKLVVHTLESLTGAIVMGGLESDGVIWSTFYDIRRYGGLQIFLRAALRRTSLVLSSAHEPTAGFLARAGFHGVTHISGTPSHWRRALMSSAASRISPQYVRLSGEIADQAVLNQLRTAYPEARISHAFATTEAGVAFDVPDGLAGFPVGMIEQTPNVEMKVEGRSLHVRSNRTARRYLGGQRSLRDDEGFVDTGDALELREDRYYFVGRGDGMINVGGMKVYPEEVEAVINGHPEVEVSLVRTKKNPITGALVVADVVLKRLPETAGNEVRSDIMRLCRETLPSHKVPALINFVPALAVAGTGKLLRLHA